MVYADGGAQHVGMALTGSQMRSERRLEGTRGNTKVGQKKRSETKYGCGGDGDYHKGVAICYILLVVMCGDGVAGAGTEHKADIPFW